MSAHEKNKTSRWLGTREKLLPGSEHPAGHGSACQCGSSVPLICCAARTGRQISVIRARRPSPRDYTFPVTPLPSMCVCWRNVVSSSRSILKSSQRTASRKTATCSTPSSQCMRSRRHTTTGNLKKRSSLLCSRKRRRKLRNWASSSSRRAMGKAHEHPVFAPVCRCVRPFGAGWSPSPNEGVGTVLPPFGRGCEDERKSGIKPWRHFRRYGQPQLPAVRAVYGDFATPLRCMCSGVCFRAFVHDWRLLSPNRRWSQAFQRHLI